MLAREKMLDDIARVAGGTISVVSGLSQQIKQEIRARVDELALRFDLVPREEFEKLEAMLREAREEQIRQSARIDALEQSRKQQPSKKG